MTAVLPAPARWMVTDTGHDYDNLAPATEVLPTESLTARLHAIGADAMASASEIGWHEAVRVQAAARGAIRSLRSRQWATTEVWCHQLGITITRVTDEGDR